MSILSTLSKLMPSNLIVNADDLGMTPGVTAGIVEAHCKGILTSASLMVNVPWLEEVVAALRGCPPLGVGLHFNLTHGRPTAPAEAVNTLVNRAGTFFDPDALNARRVNPAHVQRELAAQFDLFTAKLGQLPTHLDIHHRRIEAHPDIFPVVLDFAIARALPLRVRASVQRQQARKRGGLLCDAVIGDVGEEPYWTTERLKEAIELLSEGTTELVCHPGYLDEPLQRSRYSWQREVELRALCDPSVRAAVERRGVRLRRHG
ncbi:MAG: ChbG/HpnK family deacetylase [Abditibacteriales bacterium]|nr:ChbG/HpnK family deacetylase [Abditibacteriales bacterium]